MERVTRHSREGHLVRSRSMPLDARSVAAARWSAQRGRFDWTRARSLFARARGGRRKPGGTRCPGPAQVQTPAPTRSVPRSRRRTGRAGRFLQRPRNTCERRRRDSSRRASRPIMPGVGLVSSVEAACRPVPPCSNGLAARAGLQLRRPLPGVPRHPYTWRGAPDPRWSFLVLPIGDRHVLRHE